MAVRNLNATGPILGLGLTPNGLTDLTFASKPTTPPPPTAPIAPTLQRWADASVSVSSTHNMKLSQVPKP